MPEPVHLELSHRLTLALVEGEGMNDFLNRFMHAIAEVLGTPRVVLYDYDEQTDGFELLYFLGYSPDARGELTRRLRGLELQRALERREPYAADTDRSRLLPLYFQETLEAVLLVEASDGDAVSPDRLAAVYPIVSRFLGLFMSSSRLPVNQRRESFHTLSLERAREVQLSYLPPPSTETRHFEIFGYNQSAALVGGDYFDYYRQRPGSLQFVVADACGHGMPAALTISAFRGMLMAATRREGSLESLFDELNEQLYTATDQLQYLTGVFCDYDHESRELLYLNAGHHRPLLLRASGDHTTLGGGGLPLGMFAGSRYEPLRCRVAPDDLLVLFTDGVVEIQDAADAFFGIERILSAAREHRERPLRTLVREILARAEAFSSSAQPEDDMTLFLVRFR
jgi:hypothetical protein